MTSKQNISIRHDRPVPAETAPAPARWEPFSSLYSDFARLIDQSVVGWPSAKAAFDGMPWVWQAAAPLADIIERDGEFILELDVPGIDENDIEVSLTDGYVTISGKSTAEKSEDKENFHLSERRHGAFTRAFTLPATVDPEKIAARYDKGVLKLIMPKNEDAKKRQRNIEIKAA